MAPTITPVAGLVTPVATIVVADLAQPAGDTSAGPHTYAVVTEPDREGQRRATSPRPSSPRRHSRRRDGDRQRRHVARRDGEHYHRGGAAELVRALGAKDATRLPRKLGAPSKAPFSVVANAVLATTHNEVGGHTGGQRAVAKRSTEDEEMKSFRRDLRRRARPPAQFAPGRRIPPKGFKQNTLKTATAAMQGRPMQGGETKAKPKNNGRQFGSTRKGTLLMN